MRYMCDKSRIAKQIATYINNIALIDGISNYYEPFCRGYAVAEQVNIKNRYCSDANKYLIALMNKVKTGSFPSPGIDEFEYVYEDTWMDVKANIGTNKYEDWYIGYVGIIGSYGGWWFERHTPYYENQLWEYLDILRDRDIESLKNIIFNTVEYDNVVIENNSIVYCCAPCLGTNNYMTGKFDFNKYYDWLKEISKNNLVLISEYSMPHGFKEIYSWPPMNGDKSTVIDSSIERLFVVEGGYLVDKYFNKDCIEYLL